MQKPVNKTSLEAEARAFRPISGHRALDFLATLRDRHREPSECLREPADLERWFTIAGLPLPGHATPADLRDARRLRESINGVVRAAVAGEPLSADDLSDLNDWACRAPLAPQADQTLQRHWTADHEAQAALALIAREAVELLTGADLTLIRECAAAPKCSRLYIDRSPGRQRRWCRMDWCGSRAKMTSYRERRRTR